MTARVHVGRRAGRRAAACLLGAAFLLGAGCATLEGEDGDARGVMMPPSAPKLASAPAPDTRGHAELVRLFGGVYEAPALERLLADTVQRLVAASDRPAEAYGVTVLNAPAINAFALPNGNLYVTRGLLALASDTAEVAAVLAHEIAHVTARHASERAEREARSALLSRVANEVLNDPAGGQRERSLSRLRIASFSRQQELEADGIGVRTIARAGYDPYGSQRFLVSLGRDAALRAGAPRGPGAKPGILSSHPTTPERVQRALLAARQIGAPGLGERDRNAWLTALEGVSFGEGPADGFVRGRRYLHPVLGIGLTAPDGFALEIEGGALIGVAPEGQGGAGQQAFRFDVVTLAPGVGLEEHLRTGVIEGASAQGVETSRIDGQAAVTGTLRGRDLTFRVGLVQHGSSVYRLLFATDAPTPALDGAYLDAIRSFRRLDPEEARGLRPPRIAILTAGEGDTQERLTERMSGVDRAPERFGVLNGLEPGAPLRVGERYKIVVE